MISTLGSSTAQLTLYLPNPPARLPPTMSLAQPDIAQLTELNGNHWRKIFTILAKLCAPDEDWRSYRDQQLLRSEQISFTSTLADHQGWHLVAGKSTWQRLGFASEGGVDEGMECLEEQGRLFRQGRILLVPYPDYRQFPNQLIEQLRAMLHN